MGAKLRHFCEMMQECLLLQVKRLPRGVLRKTMEEVFTDYFDEFTKKHWDKIKAGLELNDTQVETLQADLCILQNTETSRSPLVSILLPI